MRSRRLGFKKVGQNQIFRIKTLPPPYEGGQKKCHREDGDAIRDDLFPSRMLRRECSLVMRFSRALRALRMTQSAENTKVFRQAEILFNPRKSFHDFLGDTGEYLKRQGREMWRRHSCLRLFRGHLLHQYDFRPGSAFFSYDVDAGRERVCYGCYGCCGPGDCAGWRGGLDAVNLPARCVVD